MGSWANSLHVRHPDADAVANAIRLLMVGQGHREKPVERPKLATVLRLGDESWPLLPDPPAPSIPLADQEEYEDDEDMEDGDDFADDLDASQPVLPPAADVPQERNVCVFRARSGWTGVLVNSDIWDLAPLLSAHLHTDTMTVMVNHSDSWLFQIHRDGMVLDEFDSSGAAEDDGPSPELRAAIESGDEQAVLREMLKNAPQGPIHMPSGDTLLPPELAMLSQRVASGQATFWQRVRSWWLTCKFLFQMFTGRWQAHPIDMGFDIPRETPLDAETLQGLVEHLQAIFPDAGAKALRDILPLNRFPAEELLRKFLEIVGLPGFYAYLSYEYLEDHTRDELAGEGIEFASEMCFTTPADL